jgi:hypothetical protein
MGQDLLLDNKQIQILIGRKADNRVPLNRQRMMKKSDCGFKMESVDVEISNGRKNRSTRQSFSKRHRARNDNQAPIHHVGKIKEMSDTKKFGIANPKKSNENVPMTIENSTKWSVLLD